MHTWSIATSGHQEVVTYKTTRVLPFLFVNFEVSDKSATLSPIAYAALENEQQNLYFVTVEA